MKERSKKNLQKERFFERRKEGKWEWGLEREKQWAARERKDT